MLIDDLSGGKFKSTAIVQKQQVSQENYGIYIQFDGDEPKQLFTNIKVGDNFHLTIHGPGPSSELIFTDNITGKQFKLFAK